MDKNIEKIKIIQKIKSFFYSINCFISNKILRRNKKKSSMKTMKRHELAFICIALSFPMLIFLVFYVGVNINCILLSFKDYDGATKSYIWSGFSHFFEFFEVLKTEEFMGHAIKNSIILFTINLAFNLPFHIFNAFYVFKKYYLHKFFRYLLFLPSILSSVITTTMFKYFTIYGIQGIFNLLNLGVAPQFLYALETGFTTTLVYSVWINFGSSIILFLGLMNRISTSVLEAASLDGVNAFQEFFHIVLPLIFPTISIYIINLIAGFFSNQGSLFTFYGANARKEFYTFGYYYYTQVLGDAGVTRYPMAAASGVIFTIIVAPVTLFARWLLNKFFPSIDY